MSEWNLPNIGEPWYEGGPPRCCEEDQGGSHWHCGNCGEVSSMYGHYSKDGFYCEKKEDVDEHQSKSE